MRESLSGASTGARPPTRTSECWIHWPLLRPEQLAVFLLSLCLVFSPLTFAGRHSSGFVTLRLESHRVNTFDSRPHQSWNANRGSESAEKKSNLDPSRLPNHVVQSLDLAPVVRALANHAGTRRGREAILGWIVEEQTAARLLPSVSEAVSAK